MKQADVQVGKVYQVKVSGALKAVKVQEDLGAQGIRAVRKRYSGLVLSTGRKITLTAGRMRKEIPTGTHPLVSLVSNVEAGK